MGSEAEEVPYIFRLISGYTMHAARLDMLAVAKYKHEDVVRHFLSCGILAELTERGGAYRLQRRGVG